MAHFARAPARIAAIFGAALAFALAANAAAAQTYPSGPVRVVVPFAAGGSTDILARVFSERLQQSLGQSFTVENRSGAAGQIAAAAFARAAPDGYTLMFTTAAPITSAPQMVEKPQYDPLKDFIPVAMVAVMPVWLVVHAASPFRTFADAVKHGKDNPGTLNYGSPGLGSEPHLAAEAVAQSAGIRMVHVPFRGGGEVVPALLGRQIDLASLATASIASGLTQGALRALAVSSPQRMADFPDVPTFTELGHPKATMLPWWGLMAPAGTPAAIVSKLAQELEAATKNQAVRDRLKATFAQIEFSGPQALARYLETETKMYGEIIRAANIKLK